MKQGEALAWFDELISRAQGLIRPGGALGKHYDPQEFSTWIAEASSAISSVFPSNHAIARLWEPAVQRTHTSGMNFAGAIKSCIGAIEAARNLVRDGRLSSIVDGVRAETVDELLDQADYLADQKYTVAATVVAGGALETFLHFICVRNGLTWENHGSIEKYKGALAQARKAGNEIISSTDEKSVNEWGGRRNDAAHKPAEFKEPPERVKLMIEGIRQFIRKYA